jgi:hypothetical protein
MDLFNRDDLRALLAERPGPCVSIFLPTHRGGAEADPIHWRGLLDEAQRRLADHGLRPAGAAEFLAPARGMLDDPHFWKHQGDGLAAFLAAGFFRHFRLPVRFDEVVVAAATFHLRPLLPLLAGDGRFYVLALSSNGVRLVQGTHFSAGEIDLKGVPANLAAALLRHDVDEPLTFHTRPTAGGGWGAIYHGHGVGIDDAKDDLLRYFQQIDRGLHGLLREERAPLVLASVDYLQPLYRKASTYPHLLEQGIEGNPDRLSARELHDRAWPLVRPLFEEARQRAAAQYRQLAGTGHASGDLAAVVAAAHAGRVETLFVALGRQVWGIFDPSADRVERHEQAAPGDVDLLDFAAAQTLRHGRTVYAVEPPQVPSRTDVAAIFCLPLPKHGKRP